MSRLRNGTKVGADGVAGRIRPETTDDGENNGRKQRDDLKVTLNQYLDQWLGSQLPGIARSVAEVIRTASVAALPHADPNSGASRPLAAELTQLKAAITALTSQVQRLASPAPVIPLPSVRAAVDAEVRTPLTQVERALNGLGSEHQRGSSVLLSKLESLDSRMKQAAARADQASTEELLRRLCQIAGGIAGDLSQPREGAMEMLASLLEEHDVYSFVPKVGEAFDPVRHCHFGVNFHPVATPEAARRIHLTISAGWSRDGRLLLPATVVVTQYKSK